MAARKTHGISIKVGQYTDPRDNQVKSRTRSIGKLMRGDDGRQFIILNAECLSTQLFALARKKGEDTVILSLWDEDQRPASGPGLARNPVDEDDIP